MTALPPDPDPARFPDLESGGGVAPGSTPPDSAQTSVSPPDPRPGRRLTPTAVISLVAVALFAVLFVATVAVLIFHVW